MPELPVTDEQLQRLRSVCEDLEAAYVGPYGSVQPDDALEYLLDTYSPPEEGDDAEPGGTTDTDADTDAAEDSSADLTAIQGVGEVTATALAEAGFDTPAAIEAADPAALTAAEGIGEKQAVDIVAAATEVGDPTSDADGADDTADAASDAEDAASDADSPGDGDPATDSPEATLQQAMSLLDAHDDRWREGSGDEPYEVDLPDGSTEAVRTKDDVKRLLFKHWK